VPGAELQSAINPAPIAPNLGSRRFRDAVEGRAEQEVHIRLAIYGVLLE
jgi:hypothetical protein